MSKQGSFGTMSGRRVYINQHLTDDLVATNQGVVGSIPASRTKNSHPGNRMVSGVFYLSGPLAYRACRLVCMNVAGAQKIDAIKKPAI
jgi:hypothetical protein